MENQNDSDSDTDIGTWTALADITFNCRLRNIVALLMARSDQSTLTALAATVAPDGSSASDTATTSGRGSAG